MGIFSWLGKKKHIEEAAIRKLTLWDFGLVKICLILLGIIIGAYISVFVKEQIWYFGGAAAVLFAIVLYRVFMKK